jgi:hypothetical protein
MTPIATALRRTLLLTLLALAVGAAVTWWRSQATAPTPASPPQWPDWPERNAEPMSTAEPTASTEPTAAAEPTWVPGTDDGSAPASHPIKAKESSGIFHVPGGRFYDRTKPDRCYPTASAAEADGYRQSKT